MTQENGFGRLLLFGGFLALFGLIMTTLVIPVILGLGGEDVLVLLLLFFAHLVNFSFSILILMKNKPYAYPKKGSIFTMFAALSLFLFFLAAFVLGLFIGLLEGFFHLEPDFIDRILSYPPIAAASLAIIIPSLLYLLGAVFHFRLYHKIKKKIIISQ